MKTNIVCFGLRSVSQGQERPYLALFDVFLQRARAAFVGVQVVLGEAASSSRA
jgi:hypothetical protein